MAFYTGYLGDGKGRVFSSKTKPSADRHPEGVKFAFGGFTKKTKALQVGNYQGYQMLKSGTWNGKHLSEIKLREGPDELVRDDKEDAWVM